MKGMSLSQSASIFTGRLSLHRSQIIQSKMDYRAYLADNMLEILPLSRIFDARFYPNLFFKPVITLLSWLGRFLCLRRLNHFHPALNRGYSSKSSCW